MTDAVAGMPPRAHLVVAAAATLAFVILFSWTWQLPLLVAVLVTGAFVGLCAPSTRGGATLGLVAGLAGSGVSAALYAGGMPRGLVSAGASVALGGMPSLYALLIDLGEHGPVATVASLGVALTIAIGTLGTGGVAWIVGSLLLRGGGRVRRSVAVAVVALTCASYAHTALSVSGPVFDNAGREPVRGQYAYDSIVYLKTYYGMLRGQDYYEALLDAAAGDRRLIEDGSIRDGKYREPTWMWGPSAMRRPTIFYVWKYLAPSGGGGIVALAALASAALLAVLAWGLGPYLGRRTALVPAIAMPYVLFMTLGRNIFFPDYWGALLSMVALILVMRRRWVAGAVVLLVSATVRETAGPALAVMAATLFVVWLRRGRAREWLRRAAAYAGGFLAWLGFERLHESLGARYIAFEYPSSATVLLDTATTRTLDRKLVVPTNYLVPGGFLRLRGVLLLSLAVAGYRAVLAPEREVRVAVLAYMAFWAAFLVVIGATSEYWGQTIVLPAVVGTASLLLVADRLDRRGEMSSSPGWD